MARRSRPRARVVAEIAEWLDQEDQLRTLKAMLAAPDVAGPPGDAISADPAPKRTTRSLRRALAAGGAVRSVALAPVRAAIDRADGRPAAAPMWVLQTRTDLWDDRSQPRSRHDFNVPATGSRQ